MIDVRLCFTRLVGDLIGVYAVQGNEFGSRKFYSMHLGRMSTKLGDRFRCGS